MADDFRVAGGYVEVVARVNERSGREAGDKLADDVEKQTTTRLRDERGRFVKAGSDVGSSLSEGVEREVGNGLTRTRKRFEDEGDKSGKGFFRTFGDAFKGGWGSFLSSITFGFAGPGLSESFKSSPLAASIGLALAAGVVAVAAPAIGAGIVAALGAGTGLGVIIAGAILAFKRDPALKAAGADLGKTIMGVDTGPLQDAYTAAQAKLTAALASHSATRIAQARKEAADTKKALVDAQTFNAGNVSLPELARGAFTQPLLQAIDMLKATFQAHTGDFKQMFDTLAPAIEPLSAGLAGLLDTAMPGFLEFLKVSSPLLIKLATVLPDFGEALGKAFSILSKGGPGAIDFLGDFVTWVSFMIVYLATLISWLSQGYKAIRDFFTSIPKWAKEAGDWFDKTWGKIERFASGLWKSVTGSAKKGTDDVINYLEALPGRGLRALERVPKVWGDLIMGAARGMAFAVGWGVGQVVSWVAALPGRTWAVLSAIPGLLGDLFTWAWNVALGVIKYQVGVVVGEAKALPGQIWSALSALGHLLGDLWDWAWSTAVKVIKYQIGVVTWEIKKLPGMLWNIGEDIVGGLVNGIESASGRLWNMAKDLAGRFLKGFKSALGISSPSKVMADLGEHGIGAGLIQGIDNSRRGAGGAATMLADAVVRPFGAIDMKPGAIAPAGASGPAGANGSFGPYVIQVGDKTLTAFVVDAVTGAPREVTATVDGGRRRGSGFANTARRRDA